MFYCYIYKVNGIPRYVGKGCRRRVVDHLSHRDGKKGGNKAFISYLRSQLALGIEPDIEVIFCESEQEAFDLEIAYIAEYGRLDNKTGTLFNHTNGGEGISGWAQPAAQKAKHRQYMSGKNNPMFGKPPTNKGKPHTANALAKMSAASSGKNNSIFGTHRSDITKQKLREFNIGKPSPNRGIVMFINSAGDIKKFKLGDIIPAGYDFKVKYPQSKVKYTLTSTRELISIENIKG